MHNPSINPLVEGSFNYSWITEKMQDAVGVEKFLGIDWAQYPLIAILLIVIYFAQKFYREDRATQDSRLDRVLDGYQKALTNNTEALTALESTLKERQIDHG